MSVPHLLTRVRCSHLYKWRHSRDAVVPALVDQYTRLIESGWGVREADVHRDVALLFGGAYEAFMAK